MDFQALVGHGLDLIGSESPSSVVYGWGAVTAAIRNTNPVPPNIGGRIEATALEKATRDSLTALRTLYGAAPDLRRRRLFDGFGPAGAEGWPPIADDGTAKPTAFIVAALIEAGGTDALAIPSGEIRPAATTDDGSDAMAWIARLLGLGREAGDLAQFRAAWARAISSSDILQVTVAICFAWRADLTTAAWPDPPQPGEPDPRIALVAYLNSWTPNPITPFAALVMREARAAATVLHHSTGAAIAAALAGLYSPGGIDHVTPLEDRQVELTPDPGSSMFYKMSRINGGSFKPIEELAGHGSAGPLGVTPAFRAFVGTNSYVGAAFCELTKTTTEADTPGVSLTALGVQHKCYRRKDPNDPPFSSAGTIVYQCRVGYQPLQETNWIAVRWKGAANFTDVWCVGRPGQPFPITREPGTDWRLYTTVPTERLEFEAKAAAHVYEQGPGVATGMWTAPLFEEYIEILEINTVATASLPDVSIQDVRASSPSNGLLSYVASLQRALQTGGWLVPTAGTLEDRAALALARLMILGAIARQDPAIPSTSDVSADAVMLTRRAYLRAALPVAAYRIFQAFAPQLEHDLLLGSAQLPNIEAARDSLTQALAILADITAEQARQFLSGAGRILNLGDADPTLANLDALVAAVIGAQEAVSRLQHESEELRARRCALLRSYQWEGGQGNVNVLPMRTDPQSLGLCPQD